MSTSSSDWDDDEEFVHNRNLEGIITALFIQSANQLYHTPRCTRRRYLQSVDDALRERKQIDTTIECTHSVNYLHPDKRANEKERLNSAAGKVEGERKAPLPLKEVIVNALRSSHKATANTNLSFNKNSNSNSNSESVKKESIDEWNRKCGYTVSINDVFNTNNLTEHKDFEKINAVAQSIVNAIKTSTDPTLIASSILRALQDPLNCELRERLLNNTLTAQELVNMDDESLLNPIARDKVAQERQRRLEQKTVEYIEQLNAVITHLYTCPSCSNTECYANFRSTDFVKWQGDDPTPTLLTCTKCRLSFRA